MYHVCTHTHTHTHEKERESERATGRERETEERGRERGTDWLVPHASAASPCSVRHMVWPLPHIT